jgi:hypothetical protein
VAVIMPEDDNPPGPIITYPPEEFKYSEDAVFLEFFAII